MSNLNGVIALKSTGWQAREQAMQLQAMQVPKPSSSSSSSSSSLKVYAP